MGKNSGRFEEKERGKKMLKEKDLRQ